MSKKTALSVSFLISIGVFAYLSFHHYSLALGLEGGQFCQVNQFINCDRVAQSAYSEIFGIPVAVLGLCYSLYMFIYSFCTQRGWLDISDNRTQRMHILKLKLMTAAAAIFSFYLASVSLLFLKTLCPFCMAAYILAFLQFGLVWWNAPTQASAKPTVQNLNVSELLNEHKGYWLWPVAIPFLAWFVSANVTEKFGLENLRKVAPEKIFQWSQMPLQNFNANLGLSKGDVSASKVVVEFADFKCPHCKTAARSLGNFLKSRSDVRMIFKPYPLDGQCNPHVSFRGDGSRCQMAALVLCAEKVAQKGWLVHDFFFNEQDRLGPVADIKPEFIAFAKTQGLPEGDILSCSDSAETYDIIKQIAQEGKTAQISGTPAIFVQGRKLDLGQFSEILRLAIDSLPASP
jgi:uncharacterized membrane protein/protein-disulfide isomerase